MRKTSLAPLLLLLLPSMSASCVADVDDRTAPESVAVADEPVQVMNVTLTGPCADACKAAAAGRCNWRADCEGRPYGITHCEEEVLSCDEAEHAADGRTAGLLYCYRECKGLR